MKSKISFLVVFAVLIGACGSEDEGTPTIDINDTFDPTMATLQREGTLMGSGSYRVSGTAKIYDRSGTRVLLLDPFSSSNGPDLKVYLSTTTSASSFVNLGNLKSTTGKQSYAIPASVGVNEMKFVLIWCQRFSVQFGKAETQ